MDILIIHRNYPGQFIHLAPLLGKTGNRVVFLTAREDIEEQEQQGLRIKKFKSHRMVDGKTHHYLKTTEETVIQGQAVVRAINELIEEV